MDFSLSQRASHAEEYADARIYAFPGFKTLSLAAQKIQRLEYIKEAEEAEAGCDFHFMNSVENVSAHIPTERRLYFKSSTYFILFSRPRQLANKLLANKALLSKTLSRDEFNTKW